MDERTLRSRPTDGLRRSADVTGGPVEELLLGLLRLRHPGSWCTREQHASFSFSGQI